MQESHSITIFALAHIFVPILIDVARQFLKMVHHLSSARWGMLLDGPNTEMIRPVVVPYSMPELLKQFRLLAHGGQHHIQGYERLVFRCLGNATVKRNIILCYTLPVG